MDSIEGNIYFVIFIDDFSQKLWVYLIKKKSDVLEVFTKFKSMVERQNDRKIKTLRTDDGGEYVLKDFYALCEKERILHEMVPLYTLKQNGTVERNNRTIMDMAKSILRGKHLPNELWSEVVSTTIYILNICSTKKLEGITLEEYWSGVKLSLNHLKVFGFIAHRHVLDQLRTKLHDKSSQMVMMGYNLIGEYKLFDPLNRQVVISRDMIVDD